MAKAPPDPQPHPFSRPTEGYQPHGQGQTPPQLVRNQPSSMQQPARWRPSGRAEYWLTPEQADRLTLYPWWYSRWPWIGVAVGFGLASLLWKVVLP